MLRLLVSVRDAAEAAIASAAGADIIDAKDPARGALAPVSRRCLQTIVSAVGREVHVPVSAALGDVVGAAEAARALDRVARIDLAFVKVGFGGLGEERGPAVRRVVDALTAARRAAESQSSPAVPGIVAVAYADAADVGAPSPWDILTAAGLAGVYGILLDTASKDGGSLATLWPHKELARWVSQARERGLQTALAGRLGLGDVRMVHEVGADIVGVRGAACRGGRTGVISAELTARLVRRVRSPSEAGAEQLLKL